MPNYTIECDTCIYMIVKRMPIPSFLLWKGEAHTCPKCGGQLRQQIAKVGMKIEKSHDQIMADIQQEVQETVRKINSGDQKAMRDVYGDSLNPHKA